MLLSSTHDEKTAWRDGQDVGDAGEVSEAEIAAWLDSYTKQNGYSVLHACCAESGRVTCDA
eukprot:1516834-Rhodomonas_salina.3